MTWRLAGCPHCGGDLYQEGLEGQWFTCLMCGRSYAIGLRPAAAAQLSPPGGEKSPVAPSAEAAGAQ